MAEEEESELQNLVLKKVMNISSLKSVVVNQNNLQERTEIVDSDVRDIKIEVENILEHSSGASFLERMLQNFVEDNVEESVTERKIKIENLNEKMKEVNIKNINENENEMKKEDEAWEKKFDHDFKEVSSNTSETLKVLKSDTLKSEIPPKSLMKTAIQSTSDSKLNAADKVINDEELESELSASYLASKKDISLLRANKYQKRLLEEKQKKNSFF